MYPAVPDRNLPSITPLTARSVALSTLLGYHPPALPISALVKVGELFGIRDRAIRVALTRMVRDGDVTVDNGVYRLSERLLRRQAQQDALASPPTRRWTGGWEMAVVTSTNRPLAERVALRKSMVLHRLGELREGVWMRPDNLSRELDDGIIADQCEFFVSHHPDSPSLAASLWDLPGWAAEADRLLTVLDEADSLAQGFMATAQVIRHLLLDPYLPDELLPAGWPGDRLRERYTDFNANYSERLRKYSVG
jgi:phenylacetic acid degradation operon negative regulatory protein